MTQRSVVTVEHLSEEVIGRTACCNHVGCNVHVRRSHSTNYLVFAGINVTSLFTWRDLNGIFKGLSLQIVIEIQQTLVFILKVLNIIYRQTIGAQYMRKRLKPKLSIFDYHSIICL